MKFILGKKLEMSQIFDEKGNVIPVTLVEAGPCYVVEIKKKDKNGYEAVQIGFGKAKKLAKPEKGHLEKISPYGGSPAGRQNPKSQIPKLKYLREFRDKKGAGQEQFPKPGEEVKVSVFKIGDKIAVSGVSKGKGFAGVIKRWNFNRKPTTHGAKHETRALGSVGSRFPQRVIKGKRMPGRLGSERVTIKNLIVAAIDEKNNILAIKGALPGRRGTLLEIRR